MRMRMGVPSLVSPSTEFEAQLTSVTATDFELHFGMRRLCNSSSILQPAHEGASRSPTNWQEDTPGTCSSSGRGLPVYVMLPLDTVWVIDRGGLKSSTVKREKALTAGLRTLKRAGVEGVMVDVWWGVVEREGPRCYDFTAYRRLFEQVSTGERYPVWGFPHSLGNSCLSLACAHSTCLLTP